MIFVSPESLKMHADITNDLISRSAEIEETEDMGKVLSVSDVIYVTRV